MPRLHAGFGIPAARLIGEYCMIRGSNFHRTQQWQLAERLRYLTEPSTREKAARRCRSACTGNPQAGGGDVLPNSRSIRCSFARWSIAATSSALDRRDRRAARRARARS